MTFTLAGFDQGGGFRRFVFRYASAGQPLGAVVVRADLGLARKHAIRLQELPLICVHLLETLDAVALGGPITLTEEHMIRIEKAAREAADKKLSKPPPRRPANPDIGSGWRTPRP